MEFMQKNNKAALRLDAAKFNASKETWKSFFDTALMSCLDYEMTNELAVKVVSKCALIADAALEAYESRWRYE